ncbi:MAG TPA: hypothetical protein VF530_10115 [Planctomycetota bacterium]
MKRAPTSCRLAAAVLALLAPALAAQAGSEPLLSIVRHEAPAGLRWTVLCQDVPLDELLDALARKAGLSLDASGASLAGATLTLELRQRPLEEVLAVVLGSQGLVPELARRTLRVTPEPSDPQELLRLALAAWQVVEARGDGHAVARARLARGELLELRGELEDAYALYAELALEGAGEERHEATFRAGRVLQRLGHWAEAAQHFRTLAGLEEAVALRTRARLELARCSIELGDAKSAVHLLNFLAANFPEADATELAERRLVRARAQNAMQQHLEALRTLEEGDLEAAPEAHARTLALRAEALQGLGFEVEAARGWLIFARDAARPEERSAAFRRAAELALAGGDELGALFVCREAARSGADEGLGALAHQARVRLGLDEDEPPATIQERLTLAESLVVRGDMERADELFEGLYRARGALPEPDQARIVAGWARVLAERSGLAAAVQLLSQSRRTLLDPAALRGLDVAAAALFEAEGRFAEAAEAYRGNY